LCVQVCADVCPCRCAHGGACRTYIVGVQAEALCALKSLSGLWGTRGQGCATRVRVPGYMNKGTSLNNHRALALAKPFHTTQSSTKIMQTRRGLELLALLPTTPEAHTGPAQTFGEGPALAGRPSSLAFPSLMWVVLLAARAVFSFLSPLPEQAPGPWNMCRPCALEASAVALIQPCVLGTQVSSCRLKQAPRPSPPPSNPHPRPQ